MMSERDLTGHTIIEGGRVDASALDLTCEIPQFSKRSALRGYDNYDDELVGEEQIDAAFAEPLERLRNRCGVFD